MQNTKSNLQLQDDVRDELRWDPEVNSADIGVSVMNGVVTLRGTVGMYGEKWAAERDVLRIAGVRALANDLTVARVAGNTHTDADLALHSADALQFDGTVPNDRIEVKVEGSWVTLTGTTDWYYQRSAAETDARRVVGVKGVLNKVTIVQPHVAASAIQSGIEQALVRTAEADAAAITIAVDGARVTLTGTVQSWAERDAAALVAWRAQGVTDVINALVIAV